MKKIGYVGGFWASNIGNSFYNLGALYLLKKLYGKDNVFFIPDPPQHHWTWVKNDYNLIQNLDLDLFIFSGPCLDKEFLKVYKKTFDTLKKRNKKIAFISVSVSKKNEKEAQLVANFLNKYELEFFLTRDSLSFDLYKNLINTHVYNGLCTSMFLNDAIKFPKLNDEFVVYNFSSFVEPKILLSKSKIEIKKGNFFSLQSYLNEYKIIRTNNETFKSSKFSLIFNVILNRLFKKNLFHSIFSPYLKNNTYYSDLPYGYFSILKSAKLVFSDRVHTCAATLIFGGRAMYIKHASRSNDTRNTLFSRIGLSDIYNKPVSLDMGFIESEKQKMYLFLEKIIKKSS